jgi:hypothetical protein
MTNSQSDQSKSEGKADSTKRDFSPNLLARKKAAQAAAANEAANRDKARVDVLTPPR